MMNNTLTPPKPRIAEVIVVEGRYDKNTVAQAVDAVIIELGGFSVYNNYELCQLLRALATCHGLIIMTDSDSAGFQIRGHLKGILPPDRIKHAYVPDVFGREKRKRIASSEGKLGVEGMSRSVILEALTRCGATFLDADIPSATNRLISPALFYELKLSGSPDSAARRDALKQRLGLPQRMSTSALRDALGALVTEEELRDILRDIM